MCAIIVHIVDKIYLINYKQIIAKGIRREVNKSVWRMPRLSETKKDVTSCDKLW